MKQYFLTVIFVLLVVCASGNVVADARTPIGRAQFEIYGMLNEYGGRQCDGTTVEGFYSSESVAATHFESLLHEFCAEEHIDAKVKKTIEPEGFITFYSPAIAAAIDRHFTKGDLDASVFKGASKEDLLRYVLGTYLRYGDKNMAAVIYTADSPGKLHTVGLILSRLGCTHVKLYNTGDAMVPTSDVLLFSPTEIVKTRLGIQKEVVVSDLKDFRNTLQLDEDISPSVHH